MKYWWLVIGVLVGGLFAPGVNAQQEDHPSNVLVQYSFDDDNIATGPDTFMVFNNAKGSMALSTEYQFSGFRSVELHDVAGDGEFPELQGYFPEQSKGTLYAHFALMVVNPAQGLNIALAGPAFFTMRKHGIAFWLKLQNGVLFHHPDGQAQKLFAVKPFTWYTVDVAYTFDEGKYSLEIFEEGQVKTPVVSLAQQTNVPGAPNSAVDKFSFIGDLEDESNVTCYIDDVSVSIDKPVTQLSFVAPGRRMLFVDRWNNYYQAIRQRPTWIPAIDFSDFGISAATVKQMKQEGSYKYLEGLLAGQCLQAEAEKVASPENFRLLKAVCLWNQGCGAMSAGRPKTALERYDQAAQLSPGGKIYGLSAVLALSALKQWDEVNARLGSVYTSFQTDIRLSVALAMIGTARGNLDEAKQWLRIPAETLTNDFRNNLLRRLWGAEISSDVVNELKSKFPDDWREILQTRLICEQYFFVLLWKNNYTEAEQYASRMAERMKLLGLPDWQWHERAGDAAFLAGNPAGAILHYEAALKDPAGRYVMLRMSDAYFRLGDFAKERDYREKIYGSLLKKTN